MHTPFVALEPRGIRLVLRSGGGISLKCGTKGEQLAGGIFTVQESARRHSLCLPTTWDSVQCLKIWLRSSSVASWLH